MMVGTTAYGFTQFLADMAAQDEAPDDQILKFLSNTDVDRLRDLLARLSKVRELKPIDVVKHHSDTKGSAYTKKRKVAEAQQSRLVGRLLERIVGVMLKGCKCLGMGTNIRTNTSEIDFLIHLNTLSAALPMLKQVAGSHVIGEAKCYSSGLKSEWVNELVGLMKLHGTNHSILFLACPSKKLRADARYVFHYHSGQGNRIVPFGMAQITQVAEGGNFLKVLSQQYTDTVTGSANLAI